jgi:Cdc6-like AAA superfamily ATPase
MSGTSSMTSASLFSGDSGVFPPYNAIQLQEILTQRAKNAFKEVEVYDIGQTDPMGPDSIEEPSKELWMAKQNEPDSKARALTQAAIEFAKGVDYKVGDKTNKGINIDLKVLLFNNI